MRALSIQAHPDDTEFLCGGAMALLAQRGWRIGILTCCNGDCGSDRLPAKEIAAIRLKEGKRAAETIGAEYETLGVGDAQLVFDNPTRRLVAQGARRFAPDLVFAPCAEDYVADHTICSALAADACFNAALPNYETGARNAAPPLRAVPHLYYCDPIELLDRYGRTVAPAICVDISSVIETKAEMLSRHASQREWLLRHHGIDQYVESMRAWSRARGALIGVGYAEGFRQNLGQGYPRTDLLGEALGGLRRQAKACPTEP